MLYLCFRTICSQVPWVEKPAPDVAIWGGLFRFYPLPAFCRSTSTKPPTALGRALSGLAGTPRGNLETASRLPGACGLKSGRGRGDEENSPTGDTWRNE